MNMKNMMKANKYAIRPGKAQRGQDIISSWAWTGFGFFFSLLRNKVLQSNKMGSEHSRLFNSKGGRRRRHKHTTTNSKTVDHSLCKHQKMSAVDGQRVKEWLGE